MINKEHQIGERAVLAYRWISKPVENLLDAGCDDGNNAFMLSKKSKNTWGIDINKKIIDHAQIQYPTISFSCYPVETTPFQNEFFDVIVMNDVLEHVKNEVVALNEMFRILKRGGQLIISTPHKGMFAFLDPANVKFLIKNKTLLRLMYSKKKVDKFLTNENYQENFHRHYTLKQFHTLLEQSSFKNRGTVERVFRSGLVLGVFSVDLKAILQRLLNKKVVNICLVPLFKLASLEYWLPFGPLAYNISISIKKS
jgi:2-polyprenyl-3-methyl-5-hydroxy-6-metoxy-1,4-benzoquinol methylase